MDPFAELGVPVTMELDPAELERRHLELSRTCHPDHHAQADHGEQLAMLERSARLNDAYRELVDPWLRARALLELRDPGVLARTERLAPAFLAEAMELSEEAERAEAAAAEALRVRLEREITQDLDSIRASVESADWQAAATRLHQSRYHRKALEDLRERT